MIKLKSIGYISCLLTFLILGCNERELPPKNMENNKERSEQSMKPLTLDTKIEKFNVSNMRIKACLRKLSEVLDPSFELNKRLIFVESMDVDFDEGDNFNKITLDLENIPLKELLRYLITAGRKSLSYRILDSGEVNAIIIGPLGAKHGYGVSDSN